MYALPFHRRSHTRSFLQRLSISSTLSHTVLPTAPSIIDRHRSSTFHSMEFHEIPWVPWDPWGDPWIPWGDRWDLGTDGTLGPMGPGPQGPWASRTPDQRYPYGYPYRYPARPGPGPVPDPRLPGPGAGPATRARCRMPAAGPAVFRFISPEKILKIALRTPGIKKKSGKKLQKNDKNYHFCRGRPALKNSFLEPNEPGYEL